MLLSPDGYLTFVVANAKKSAQKTAVFPRMKYIFYFNQKTTRKIMIGGVDLVDTEKNMKKLKRQEKDLNITKTWILINCLVLVFVHCQTT